MEADTAVSIRALARVFNELAQGLDICLSKLPLGWNGAYRHFRHPLDYLGADGGGGVGAGPGCTVGAALATAQKGSAAAQPVRRRGRRLNKNVRASSSN